MNLPGEVEQPRVLLVSVPYALKAADADTLGGLPASAFVLAGASGPTTMPGSGNTKIVGKTAVSGKGKAVTAAFNPVA